jgi:hypothetical protein
LGPLGALGGWKLKINLPEAGLEAEMISMDLFSDVLGR